MRLAYHNTNNHWEFQDPKMQVPAIYKAYVSEYHHNSYGLIWYSTSILGSWNSHWKNTNQPGHSRS